MSPNILLSLNLNNSVGFKNEICLRRIQPQLTDISDLYSNEGHSQKLAGNRNFHDRV